MSRRNGKRKPPPNPDDFGPPTTNGWHALADCGWEKIEHTDDCPIPDNPLRGRHHEFEGKIDQWEYKYRLCDGTGTQVNKPLRLSDAEANALFGFVDSVDALVGSQSQGSTSTGQKIYTRDEIKKRYDDLMANTNPKNWPFQAINHAIHMYEEIDENPPVELKSLQLDWYYGRRTLADIDFDKLTDTELSLHVI